MSVGEQIGLDDDQDGLLAAARDRWAGWAAMDPRLGVVERYEDLRGWLAAAEPEAADSVMLALAMLAAPDGGDDVAAAAVIARNLLPGACLLARRIVEMTRPGEPHHGPAHRVSGHDVVNGEVVDQLVASQLWIEIRTFPWRRGHKVAANVLLDTRSAVLAELGDRGRMARTNRTAANTAPVAHLSPGAGETAAKWLVALGEHQQPFGPTTSPGLDEICLERTPTERLLEVLAWACEEKVITDEDRALLLCLIDEADQVPLGTHGLPRGGLTALRVSARVAERAGVTPKAVKCRVLRSMAALAAAIPEGLGDEV